MNEKTIRQDSPETHAGGPVLCRICPRKCRLEEGEFGECRVRTNVGGEVVCATYGHPCALNLDPIEKKPLYHFLPGSTSFSVATVGCNLHCDNCQNSEISQPGPLEINFPEYPPEKIVRMAEDAGAASIAYTYTEPLVFYEYTRDISRLAAETSSLRNVLVTAAYVNPEPLREICKTIHAANVDLKYIDDALYRRYSDISLRPVLRALRILREEGVWLEVTNLLIPGLNTDPESLRMLCDWIATHLGTETPLHFSRFHPTHRMRHIPPTPTEDLLRAREIAGGAGLDYVYLGNAPEAEGTDTYCPEDGSLLIERSGFGRAKSHLLDGGRCPNCQHQIPGVWS